MTTEAQPTPTPYAVDEIGHQIYCTHSGAVVATLSPEGTVNPELIAQRKANAAFIVRAANSHEELVAAASKAFKFLEIFNGYANHSSGFQNLIDLQLALAKARGEA